MSPSPQPINFGGVGDIDMWPAETNDAMVGIAEAGRFIAEAWATAGPAIAADALAVGGGLDDLSVNFRKHINEQGPKLEQVAVEAPANFEAMGANGNQIVMQYMQLTHQQIDMLRRL
jgi:hypothetical protein